MLKPLTKGGCGNCNEFAISQPPVPHQFLVRTSTFQDVNTGVEVAQYVCARCGEEWLHAASGLLAGWSPRDGLSLKSYQLQRIGERRRGPRPTRFHKVPY